MKRFDEALIFCILTGDRKITIKSAENSSQFTSSVVLVLFQITKCWLNSILSRGSMSFLVFLLGCSALLLLYILDTIYACSKRHYTLRRFYYHRHTLRQFSCLLIRGKRLHRRQSVVEHYNTTCRETSPQNCYLGYAQNQILTFQMYTFCISENDEFRFVNGIIVSCPVCSGRAHILIRVFQPFKSFTTYTLDVSYFTRLVSDLKFNSGFLVSTYILILLCSFVYILAMKSIFTTM